MFSALFALLLTLAQAELGRPQLDRSKPVAPKSEVVAAWRKRQDAVRTLQYTWTEQQTHVRGWIPNPRCVERERVALPAMFVDRRYSVTKTLIVDGVKMRYVVDVDRPGDMSLPAATRAEPRHFTYTSVFDGRTGTSRVSSRTGDPPEITHQAATHLDAQNLDTRPILMAFRALDPILGHPLLDRAVTNQMRFFYKERSTMIVEERRDPWGWKMLVWVEPERDFLVSRYLVAFEQNVMVDVDIDYVQDRQWGWVPSGWRVTQKLSDGTRKLLSTAKVTSYRINDPVDVLSAAPVPRP